MFWTGQKKVHVYGNSKLKIRKYRPVKSHHFVVSLMISWLSWQLISYASGKISLQQVLKHLYCTVCFQKLISEIINSIQRRHLAFMFDQEIYEVPTWCITVTFQPTPVWTPSRFAANKRATCFCLLLPNVHILCVQ